MNKYNKKGVALVMAIIFFMLISISIVIILLTASNYATFAGGQVRRTQAIAIAESGIHYAYWRIRNDSSLLPTSGAGDTIFNTIPPLSDNLPAGITAIEVKIYEPVGDFNQIDSKITYNKVKASP